MDERNDELNRTVGRLIGVVEQMDKRLGEMNQSLQNLAASQETLAFDNAAQHEVTARDLTELTAETRQLKEDVKELKEDVKELKKKGGGPSLKAVDDALSFVQKWWKPVSVVVMVVVGAVATWLRG